MDNVEFFDCSIVRVMFNCVILSRGVITLLLHNFTSTMKPVDCQLRVQNLSPPIDALVLADVSLCISTAQELLLICSMLTGA